MPHWHLTDSQLTDSSEETCGLTNYGGGWRKNAGNGGSELFPGPVSSGVFVSLAVLSVLQERFPPVASMWVIFKCAVQPCHRSALCAIFCLFLFLPLSVDWA